MIDALEDPTDRQLAAWIEDQLSCPDAIVCVTA